MRKNACDPTFQAKLTMRIHVGAIVSLAILGSVSFAGPLDPPGTDPFAEFVKPGQLKPPEKPLSSPVAPAAPGAAGLQLAGNWNASNGLASGGPKQQRAELRALLTGYVEAAADTAPHPGNRIYAPVTYLMPAREAQSRAGLAGKLQSGGRTSVVGFPDGLTFTAISADGERRYETRMLKDRADQVVAVEFVATDARVLPPPPEPMGLPTRSLRGRTYDFVPEGTAATGREFPQYVWHRSDYVLIATRGNPKAADLYIPKPMVSLILYSLDHSPGT
jgi:hypothetical protein